MNLTNILSRKTTMKKAFVDLESDMADVLAEEFLLPPDPTGQDVTIEQPEPGAPEWEMPAQSSEAAPSAAVAEPAGERLTAHTQGRLSDLAALDEARTTTQERLDQIGAALASLVSTHHLSRDFINDSYADIRRANDLEILAGNLSSENSKLGERVEKLEKLRSRYDQLIEVLKRREAKLMTEAENLREALSAAKIDAVEARNALSRSEYLQGEMHTALGGKASEAERFMRENELLREKNVNLALDLDKALQRQAETRRKYEDLSAIHGQESALVAKMTAKLASEEKEAARLQKLADALEAKLLEANESVANFSREMKEREQLYQSENHALRGEIQTLVSRLQAGASDHKETAAEMTALQARLNDLESEKAFAERKAAGLAAEMESERLRHASLHEQQVKDMRRQIDDLTRTIENLRGERGADNGAGVQFPDTFGAKSRPKPSLRARTPTTGSA